MELTFRSADAFNRRDLDAYLAFCDPDIEFTTQATELEGGGSYRGHDGIRRWWGDLFSVFPDFNGEVEEVRDLGDVTVARVRMSGQGIGSEAPTEQLAWVVAKWRGIRVIWSRVCLSEAEALEAAGLSE